MKKHQPKINEFPFVTDDYHIYSQLCEDGISGVQVAHNFYSFELHSNIKNDGVDCDGLTSFQDSKILLEISLDDKRAREVIIHEIIHCLLHQVGLDETNFDGNNLIVTNEFLVDVLSKQFMLFNWQNPGVLGLLYKHEPYSS